MPFLRLLSVNPTGMYSYGMHPSIPLDKLGIVDLTGRNLDRKGDSNGAGKSSVMDAVTHILFGEDVKGASDSEVVNSVWNHGCFGVLIFGVNDQKYYRVINCRDWDEEPPEPMGPSEILDKNDKYNGTDIYFEEYLGGRWVDIRTGSMKDTRIKIRQTIGMSYEQFCAIAYLGQQRGLRFVDGKHKDRAQIFSDIQDLSIWDEGCRYASVQVSSISQEITQWLTKMETTKSNLKLQNIPDSAAIEGWRAQLVQLDGQVREAQNWLAQNRYSITVAQQRVAEIRTSIEKYREQHSDIGKDITDRFYKHTQALATCNSERDEVLADSLELIALNEAGRLYQDQTSRVKVAQEAYQKAKKANEAVCSYCGSEVTDDKRTRFLTSLHSALLAEELKQDDLSSSYDSAKRDLTAHERKINAKYDAIKAELQTAHDKGKAHLVAKQTEVGHLITSMNAEITRLEDSIKQATSMSTDVSAQIGSMERTSAGLEAAINHAGQAASIHKQMQDQIAEAEAAIKKLTIDRDYWSALAKHFGNSGIKAHKFGALVGTLEQLVRKYTAKLTDDAVQVSFSPFREKANAKSDADIVADFQIFVKEGPKEKVNIKLYSGAERQQIIVAIIIGMAKLASLQGSGVNALFLDEIFSMLNGTGKIAMVDLIGELKSNNAGTVLVVTHDIEVQKMLDCDQIWTAVKKNHITTLEMSKV